MDDRQIESWLRSIEEQLKILEFTLRGHPKDPTTNGIGGGLFGEVRRMKAELSLAGERRDKRIEILAAKINELEDRIAASNTFQRAMIAVAVLVILIGLAFNAYVVYVIARGAVHVLKRVGDDEFLLDVLGGGDLLGEMALLTGAPRNATARAVTALTVGRIDRAGFDRLLETQPSLREQVWRALRRRSFDNAVRVLPAHGHLGRVQRLAWIDSGRVAL